MGEVADPVVGPGTVLIDVHASAAAYHDVLQVADRHQVKHDLPFVPGMEMAGVVRELGPGVDAPPPGTRVMALAQGGAMAERASAEATQVWPMRDGVSFEAAAAMAMAHTTAHCGLRWEAEVRPGERVLVTGASGGVGLAAVEVATAMGAEVIAVASTDERLEVAASKGAKHGVNHTAMDVRAAVLDITDGEGVEVAFDPVTGALYEAVAGSVGWGGRHVIVGFAGGDIPRIHAGRLLVKNRRALGLVMRYYRYMRPDRMAETVATLMAWCGDGTIDPLVARRGRLDDLPSMLADIRDRRAIGRFVAIVGQTAVNRSEPSA